MPSQDPPVQAVPSGHGSRLTLPFVSRRDAALGVVVAAVMFVILGTVAAIWANPLFMRMTPTSGFEVALLLLQSLLAGIYVALPNAGCGQRTAGVGAVIGFLGVACPVCNKILVYLIGSTLLLEYFEPVRLYVAMTGVALLALAIWLKVRRKACVAPGRAAPQQA